MEKEKRNEGDGKVKRNLIKEMTESVLNINEGD